MLTRVFVIFAVVALFPTSVMAQRPTAAPSLVGRDVFSADGSKMGNVLCLKADAAGRIQLIAFKVNGFLGFGGKLVAVPDGKFTRNGDTVYVGMTAYEVSKLPEKLGGCD